VHVAKGADAWRKEERRRNRRQRRREAHREARPDPARARCLESRPASTELASAARPRRRHGSASEALSAFIDIDEAERFDLFEVNATDFWGLDRELMGNRTAARAVMEDIDDIIERVEREMATPEACGELLRRRVLDWLRHSAAAANWSDEKRERWGGLFYESREPGRRLRPSLIDRLLRFRSVAVEGARMPGFRVQRLMDGGGQDNEGGHAPGDVFLRAAQALLDDLAAAPRGAAGIHPLVRVSELGDRVGRAEVTRAIADIFSSQSHDMIVVVHPSRYPGAEFVGVQPPPRRARGPWLTYTLVVAPLEVAAAAVPGPGTAAAPVGPAVARAPPAAAVFPAQVPGPRVFAPRPTFAAPLAVFPGASVWDLPQVAPEQWMAELQSAASRGERLEPPPLLEYRNSSAFRALRDLLIRDGEARTLFIQSAWRGKPRGLPLLAALLRDGMLEPEYDTDASYLEAELEPFAPRGGAPPSGPAAWQLPGGWHVRRKVDGVLRYEASGG
jgi:hypothetical protein